MDENFTGHEIKGQVIACGQPAAAHARSSSSYANAALITQLLATYDQHPQWRKNRRIDGPAAVKAYMACRYESTSPVKAGARI